MSYSGGWRPHLESALCLDVRKMLRTRALQPGRQTSGGWQWTRDGETTASVGYRATLGDASGTLTLDYSTGREGERKSVTCALALESLPCTYGGRRWFVRCPYTHRRAWKLYKWASIEWFCHRDARSRRTPPMRASARAAAIVPSRNAGRCGTSWATTSATCSASR